MEDHNINSWVILHFTLDNKLILNRYNISNTVSLGPEICAIGKQA